jgi:hypothetical protein
MRVVNDRTLSPSARLLYVLLDDYAGMNAIAWPKQATLAERLGYSERLARECIQELAGAGYIQRQRRQRGVRYLLQWLIPTGAQAPVGNSERRLGAGGKKSDRHSGAGPTGSGAPVGNAASLYEPDHEPDHKSIDRSSSVSWMIETLAGYPRALAHIGYRPDPVIAVACLDAGGWNKKAISHAFRETYLRGGRRAHPAQSWAWFPVVLKNFFATAPPIPL